MLCCWQLDLGRRGEPYRLSWVRRLGGRVRPDDPRHGSARGGRRLQHAYNLFLFTSSAYLNALNQHGRRRLVVLNIQFM